jgi:organic hydroperoxide reductase OsmC/OhrA
MIQQQQAAVHEHAYAARVLWTGNTGEGTGTYSGYRRDHTVTIAGKPDLMCSSDAMFRGDAGRHNPEDLFVAALAGCHMLAYLALCARHGIRVLSYDDAASGVLVLDAAGGGRFREVVLRPDVEIAGDADEDVARQLHDQAHAQCFIANSCSIPVRHEPILRRVQRSSRSEMVVP